MLGNCSHLEEVHVEFEDWADDQDATKSWLVSVSNSGTFYGPVALTEIRGANNIPSGWYYVVMAHFADGTTFISDVYTKK